MRSLFIMVFISAVATFWGSYYFRSQPPAQIQYSIGALKSSLALGKPVIVTVDAKWATPPGDRPRYMSAAVSRAVRDKAIVSMTADYTNRSPSVVQLMAGVQATTVPTMLLFGPGDPGNPIVLGRHASDEEILNAVQRIEKSR